MVTKNDGSKEIINRLQCFDEFQSEQSLQQWEIKFNCLDECSLHVNAQLQELWLQNFCVQLLLPNWQSLSKSFAMLPGRHPNISQSLTNGYIVNSNCSDYVQERRTTVRGVQLLDQLFNFSKLLHPYVWQYRYTTSNICQAYYSNIQYRSTNDHIHCLIILTYTNYTLSPSTNLSKILN